MAVIIGPDKIWQQHARTTFVRRQITAVIIILLLFIFGPGQTMAVVLPRRNIRQGIGQNNYDYPV